MRVKGKKGAESYSNCEEVKRRSAILPIAGWGGGVEYNI